MKEAKDLKAFGIKSERVVEEDVYLYLTRKVSRKLISHAMIFGEEAAKKELNRYASEVVNECLEDDCFAIVDGKTDDGRLVEVVVFDNLPWDYYDYVE